MAEEGDTSRAARTVTIKIIVDVVAMEAMEAAEATADVKAHDTPTC